MKFTTRAAGILLALILTIGLFAFSAAADGGHLYAGIGFVNTAGLNLRQQPDLASPSLGKASLGDCVAVLDVLDGWYHVLYNLTEGYMAAQYVNFAPVENAELGFGSVTGSGVNLRSGPGTDSPKVGTAQNGEKLYIIGLNNGWFKVLRDSGSCYIRSDFIRLEEIPYENQASPNTPKYFRGGKSIGALPAVGTSAPDSVNGASIVAAAQAYLGVPYVYGGASPSGFDCSGFVYYVYGSLGIPVGRTPQAQYSAGTPVDKEHLQPGDIVLFAGTAASGLSHCGIYIGDGQFIHAPNSRSVVSYDTLSSGYWSSHFYCGIRVS